MVSFRRLFAASAVACAFHPIQDHIAKAHRSDDLDLDAEDDVEIPVSGSLASVAEHNRSALVETGFLDPISLTVMSGIAAAGSIISIGKTIKDIRATNRQNAEIANAIKKYEEQSVAGCAMLDTGAAFLMQKMQDLNELHQNMDKLRQVCGSRESTGTKSYTTLLMKRLEDTCSRSPEVLRETCKTSFTSGFEAKIVEACDMSSKWGSEAGLKSAKMELYKHIYQMDGLKRGTCGKGRGIAGLEQLSLLQRSQAKSESGVPLIDALGLAFTLCGFADMLVTVTDHAIFKIWGDGVQGLLAFNEHKATEAQKAVCSTSTEIWLKSFVPGNAARLASFGQRMIGVGIKEDQVLLRLAALARIPDHDDPDSWGLQPETLFLCDNRAKSLCMRPFAEHAWSQTDKNDDLGGTTHPDGTCWGVDESPQNRLVRVCRQYGDAYTAVPQACFRMYVVRQSSDINAVDVGSKKQKKILGSGIAFEFVPNLGTSLAKKVAVPSEDKYNLDNCVKPLQTLWNSELELSTMKLAEACPR